MRHEPSRNPLVSATKDATIGKSMKTYVLALAYSDMKALDRAKRAAAVKAVRRDQSKAACWKTSSVVADQARAAISRGAITDSPNSSKLRAYET